MFKSLLLYCLLIIAFASRLWGQSEAEPELFASEDILPITIHTDLKTLFRDDGEERDYHQARFVVQPSGQDSQAIAVRVMLRGNFRRENCQLPPLKLNFKNEDVANTYMDHIDKIKLVLPCRWRSDDYEQLVLKEYLMYRLFSVMTDSSFQVRLLQVTFRDSADKMDPFTKYGFFIEPVDNVEARLEAWEDETEGIHPNATVQTQTNLISVFHYMVGNVDWSIPGLHNVKLIKTDTFTFPLVIPYDFDYCGAVDAPYARGNPVAGNATVRERVYRGYCRPEQEMEKTFARFQRKKAAIYAVVQEFELLEEKEKKKLIRYLDEFYEVLDDERRRQYVFMETCRG